MRSLFLALTVVMCFVALARGIPAKGNAGPACIKACPFNYDPLCAGPQSGSGPQLSFGNDCVLDNYNCEHTNARYARVSKGECPGSTGVRLQ